MKRREKHWVTATRFPSWLGSILILVTLSCAGSKPRAVDEAIDPSGCIPIEKMTYVWKPGIYASDGGKSGHVYYTDSGLIGAHASGVGRKYQHFISTDGGETWQLDPTPEGNPYAQIISWRPNPACIKILFRQRIERVGQPGERPISTLERSTDGGKTWHKAGARLRPASVSSLTEIYSYSYDPRNCNRIFVTAPMDGFRVPYSGLFVSEDAGETFVGLMAAQGQGGIPFDVCRDNPLILYAAGTSGSVWKSEDGGATWRLVGQNDYIREYSVQVRPEGKSNARTINETTQIFQILISPDGCDTINLVTSKGIIRSGNGGKTWCVMQLGIDATIPVGSMVVYNKNPRILLAGTETGIYRTTDSGLNWRKVNLVDSEKK